MSTPTAPTAAALAALGTRSQPAEASFAQRAVDGVTGWLAKRTSRRGFLVRAGVVGSALAVDPTGYVLKPGTAYASVCGPDPYAYQGWTVFCATINNGVNACPPGSIAAGWWKMSGASLCGGGSRYIIDCNATCSCSTPGSRPGICAPECQSCRCSTGPSTSCDQRRVCCNQFRYGQCNTQVKQVGSVHCRVASCTPPWEFENCSTSTAVDQRTVNHNSSELPTRYTAIMKRYIDLGENGSVLGASVYSEVSISGGAYQRYQYGRISWTPAAGSRETTGSIGARYAALGAERSKIGFPVSYPTTIRGGVVQAFQRGRISWTSTTGSWETLGSIGARYRELGLETGLLGFPVSGETPAGAGVYQRFQRGRISWTSATGSHETLGAIGGRYLELRAESGVLGFPVSGEADTSGVAGRYQRFQAGRITWSSGIGAWETYGAIGARYDALGNERGILGLPVGGEETAPGGAGRSQRFQRGRLSWSSATGTHATYGSIHARYAELGFEGGVLGFPTGDEASAAGGAGRYSPFQGGRISYSAATGSHETTGSIWALYVSIGAEAGELGFPTSSPVDVSDGSGVFSRFVSGRISWSPDTGSHWMGERIAEAYVGYGAERGSLGYPVTDQTVLPADRDTPERRRVQFQGGTLTFEPGKGVIRS